MLLSLRVGIYFVVGGWWRLLVLRFVLLYLSIQFILRWEEADKVSPEGAGEI